MFVRSVLANVSRCVSMETKIDAYKCVVCGNCEYESFLHGEYAECTCCRVVTCRAPLKEMDSLASISRGDLELTKEEITTLEHTKQGAK